MKALITNKLFREAAAKVVRVVHTTHVNVEIESVAGRFKLTLILEYENGVVKM